MKEEGLDTLVFVPLFAAINFFIIIMVQNP